MQKTISKAIMDVSDELGFISSRIARGERNLTQTDFIVLEQIEHTAKGIIDCHAPEEFKRRA